MAQLEKSSIIKAEARELFEFFLDPGNLLQISPPGFELLDLQATVPLTPGAEFFLKSKNGWLTISWHGRVVQLEAPRLMVDEQLEGPFRKFIHTHQFRDISGHTLVIDHLEYEPPYGLLGYLVDVLFIRRRLRRTFEYRHKRLKELFETEQVASQEPPRV